MSQQEEMKNLSLLGNKETNYIFDYQPEVLNPLTIVMLKMTISSNSTVLNLPLFVLLRLNQTLRRFIFPTFLTSSASSQNPSNSTSLVTEIMGIFTKTVSTLSGKTWSTC